MPSISTYTNLTTMNRSMSAEVNYWKPRRLGLFIRHKWPQFRPHAPEFPRHMLIERNWGVETERPPSCSPGSVVPLRSGFPSNTLTTHDNSKRLRQPVFGSSLDLLGISIYPGPFSPMSRLVMWLFLAADPAPPIPPQFGLDHHPRRSPDDGFSSSAVPAMEHGTTILCPPPSLPASAFRLRISRATPHSSPCGRS